MRILISLILIFTLISCDDDKGTINKVDFDKASMLESYADGYIIPAYLELDNSLIEFIEVWNDFKELPANANHELLLIRFQDVYLKWQSVAFLNFGPASDNYFFETEFNIYPCDTNKIWSNINEGSWNLSSAFNLDAKGLPAIDFLVNYDINEERPQAYFDYLNDLILRLKDLSSSNLEQWNTSYKNVFISNDGNDRGSSISLIVNAINKYYESDLRDGKLGIPLGVRTLDVTQPKRTEALYSGFSLELLKRSITAFEDFYTNRDDKGLEEYIQAVGTNYMNGELDQKIKAQFDLIHFQLGNVQEPINFAVDSQNELMRNLYTEMQKLIPLFKIDIPSALGVLISYQDNDGD